jgi:hypothetical protein
VLDGYSRPLVRVQDYLELVERCRCDGTRVREPPAGDPVPEEAALAVERIGAGEQIADVVSG